MKRTLLGQGVLGPTAVVSSSFPRRRLVYTASQLQTRGRIARYRGTISRGYTRRAGFYGRYGMGSDSAGELKFFDTTVDDALIATGGTITPSLCLIPGGSTESTRIGRKCTIRSVDWKMKFTLPEVSAAAGAGDSDEVRLIVYQDKQTNGAAATAINLLDNSQTPISFWNLENKGRFKILWDKSFTMNRTNMASGGAATFTNSRVTKHLNKFMKCNIPLEFGGVTGALTEIRSNNIGILVTSVANKVNMASNVRVRFSDGSY